MVELHCPFMYGPYAMSIEFTVWGSGNYRNAHIGASICVYILDGHEVHRNDNFNISRSMESVSVAICV